MFLKESIYILNDNTNVYAIIYVKIKLYKVYDVCNIYNTDFPHEVIHISKHLSLTFIQSVHSNL